jgi:hypothetical protein
VSRRAAVPAREAAVGGDDLGVGGAAAPSPSAGCRGRGKPLDGLGDEKLPEFDVGLYHSNTPFSMTSSFISN